MVKNQVQNMKFGSGVLDELKKVTWPSRKETIRLTGVVVGVSLIIAVYIGAIDILFTKLLELLTKTK